MGSDDNERIDLNEGVRSTTDFVQKANKITRETKRTANGTGRMVFSFGQLEKKRRDDVGVVIDW